MNAIQSAFKSDKACKKALASYDNALAHWPVPYEQKYVTTRFGETYVMISGPEDSKPLVLLHGGGGNSSMWIYNIEGLSQHFRVYLIDLIGEAGKSAGTRPKFTTNEYACWLKEVFDALIINQATLCGASLGGTIAHQFALAYPQSISGLILLAPPSLKSMRFAFILRTILANVLPTDLFAKSFLKYMSSQGSKFQEWEVQAFVTQFQAYKLNTNKIPVLSDAGLSKLPTNTLILLGENEVIYNANALVRRVHAVAPSVTVKMIPDAKHTVSIDKPNLFNEIVINFVDL